MGDKTPPSKAQDADHFRARWKEPAQQHETASGELQASNGELITVNRELKDKVEELSRSNSDLNNLMAATNIATLFLNKELRIKRYTPSTVGLFNLTESDLGRPLSELAHHLAYPALADDARQVFDGLKPLSREVRTVEGGWYLARILPYRSTESMIDGVVITFVDITLQKKEDEARRWLSAIVESSNDAIISFTLDGEIISWNNGATRIFGYTEEEMKGRSRSVLAPPDLQDEKNEMLEALRRGEAIAAMETVRMRKDGTRIDVSVSASVMVSEAGEVMGATAIIQDITGRKKALDDLQSARGELEEKVERRTAQLRAHADQLKLMAIEVTRAEHRERLRMARLLHDHVQQLLVSAKMNLESLRRGKSRIEPEDMSRAIFILEEVLESSRSLAGDLSPPVLNEKLPISLEWLADWVKRKHDLDVRTDLDPAVDADGAEARALVFLAIREMLFNIVKHTDVREAFVTLEAWERGTLRVRVRDEGQGVDVNAIKADKADPSGHGLTGLRGRLAMIGGTLDIKSAPGKGMEAVIIVPRAASGEPES